MLDKLYNKVGSYCKNQGIRERKLGYNLRKLAKTRELAARRIGKSHDIQVNPDLKIDEDKGYTVFDGLKELQYTGDVINIAKSEFASLDRDSIDWSNKGHLYSGVLDNYTIDEESEIIKFALQDQLLNPVIDYFGFVPVLSYVGAWYSPSKFTEHTSSQLFHCDQADVKQLKVFIHCCDISDEDGALNLIDAKTSMLIRQKLKYRWDDDTQCLPDRKLLKFVSKKEWVAQEGSEGTVAFCDTSRCFHFGSRLTKDSRERLVVMLQFLSPCAFTLPWKQKKVLPFSHFNAEKFNKVEQQILGIL